MPNSLTHLFSSDENIWAIALLGLGGVFAVMVVKALLSLAARHLRKPRETAPPAKAAPGDGA